jgi:polyhydroxybutyrate depolymerase
MKASYLLVHALLLTVLNASLDARSPETRAWSVNGVEREALVYVPSTADKEAWPLVLVFHGHGGSMQQAARSLAVHSAWPEACVVYLQGLPTPGQLTDPEGRRSGWQKGPGDQQDRDLSFVDRVLAELPARHPIDARRVYATGHSNGGSFTYLLWATRPSVFAAYAPSAAVAPRTAGPLAPAPVLHIAGRNDTLVKFAWQERMIERLRVTQRCGPGEPQGTGVVIHRNAQGGPPVATYLHDGGHRYTSEATPLIVDFFKQHSRPASP